MISCETTAIQWSAHTSPSSSGAGPRSWTAYQRGKQSRKEGRGGGGGGGGKEGRWTGEKEEQQVKQTH